MTNNTAPLGLAAALLVVSAACAPPPAIVHADTGTAPSESPSIRLLHPDTTIEIAPDDDGVARVLVVVDINGIEFVPPTPPQQDAAGQGHYHVLVNDEYIWAPEAEHFELELMSPSTQLAYQPGSQIRLKVNLSTNEHRDLTEFVDWEDVFEFTIQAPASE